MFSKEIINRPLPECVHNPKMAVEFVKAHRNVFADSTRCYIEYETMKYVVIKEIERKGSDVHYWYWCFTEDGYVIYQFDHKPTKEELKEMMHDLKREVE